ncbi:MAG: cell division protein FtsB [Pseudomonadota bacterium]
MMFFLILVSILLALQLRLWQQEGLLYAYRLQQKVATQTEALNADKLRNKRLSAELNWLHGGTEAVEHHARQSLGMTKPGETFYLWVE